MYLTWSCDGEKTTNGVFYCAIDYHVAFLMYKRVAGSSWFITGISYYFITLLSCLHLPSCWFASAYTTRQSSSVFPVWHFELTTHIHTRYTTRLEQDWLEMTHCHRAIHKCYLFVSMFLSFYFIDRLEGLREN